MASSGEDRESSSRPEQWYSASPALLSEELGLDKHLQVGDWHNCNWLHGIIFKDTGVVVMSEISYPGSTDWCIGITGTELRNDNS